MEPVLKKHLNDSEEPKCTLSITDALEPRDETLRIETELPRVQKSKIDNFAPPNLVWPRAESEDAKTMKSIIEQS
jgi:hypothetical protein